MNLVIHELLNLDAGQSRRPLFELLIGGPNQSHKVNFKELPVEGKSFSKNFGFLSVNNFSEHLDALKTSGKNRAFASFDCLGVGSRTIPIEGKGDGATWHRLCKSFFEDFRENLKKSVVERTHNPPPRFDRRTGS